MKKNQGITMITLVITIIVIILLSSITIYTGINTMNSIRKKNATDTVNAIYLAITTNEDNIPSDKFLGKKLSECDNTNGEELSNDDFKLLGLNYSTENCKVVFSKTLQEDNITVVYNFAYTDDMGNTYSDIKYSFHKDSLKTVTTAEFDNNKKVNRPVIEEEMIAINYSGDDINNVYTENWYKYEKGVSSFAMMKYNGNTYAWIPRFAYKIQSFYLGKSYDNVPSTAIDIVFLRDGTSYMPNGDVINSDYTVHPAFSNGATGFWIMTKSYNSKESNAIEAINKAKTDNGGHLMKNSEYAATVLLLNYLGNSQVKFDTKELTAAGVDLVGEQYDNFDKYTTYDTDENFFDYVRGHALKDTPWNLKKESILPHGINQFILRNVNEGGEFYYEATTDLSSFVYRTVITK